MSNFNTELGVATTTNRSMSSIYNLTKTGQQSYAMNAYYSKAYYQKTNAGNCNNGNCACNCSGNIQCINCTAGAAINCVNCDAQAFIQTNCNCVTSYNCVAVTNVVYNCDCACSTDTCCFLEGSEVVMADGSRKKIEDIRVGEYLLGPYGEANPILAWNRPSLGSRRMAMINGEHATTLDHCHLRPDRSFGAVSVTEYLTGENGSVETVILADGTKERWVLPGFREEDLHMVTAIEVGDDLVGYQNGETVARKVDTLELMDLPSDTILYSFVVGGSHVYFVNDYCVTGFINAHDFDFPSWTNSEPSWTRDQYFREAISCTCQKGK
jgi:hypothetical protein